MCGGSGGRCPGVQTDAQEAGTDTLQPGLKDTGKARDDTIYPRTTLCPRSLVQFDCMSNKS